jgi:hypothetical protein
MKLASPVTAPRAPTKRTSPVWLLAVAALLLCCCALPVTGGALFIGSYLLVDNLSSLLATPTVTPTSASLATANPALSGVQQISEYSFIDDFSSEALGWTQAANANSSQNYSQGGYSMEVRSPDYYVMSTAPLEGLTHLEFAAQVLYGPENGVFGVVCYMKSTDNFYFVKIDPDVKRVQFARFLDGQTNILQDWQPFSDPGATGRFGVDCTQRIMAFYVNGELSSELGLSETMQPDRMALFASTWPDAQGAIHVLFDDVAGYKAQQ